MQLDPKHLAGFDAPETGLVLAFGRKDMETLELLVEMVPFRRQLLVFAYDWQFGMY